MALSRRQFLKWAGATSLGAVIFNGCRVPDHEIQVQSPVELPEDLVTGRDNYYATTVKLGAASEGLLVRVMEGRAKKIEGNPDYPMNTGKHGIRSESLLQALYHPDRIKHPMVRIAKGGPFRKIEWPEAIERLSTILKEAAPESVILATPPLRGQLADVVATFSDSYGSEHVAFDTLGDSVLRRAFSDLFGTDTIPDFDIANAGLILSVGADFLGTWGDTTHFMRGYGEFRQGKERSRGKLIHIDARYSATAAVADKWIYANPGTEGLLAMAMIYTIISEGLGDSVVAKQLTGGESIENAYNDFQPSVVASQIGVPAENIMALAREFADSKNGPSLAIGGGLAGAQANGLFNLHAIYALNALVGSVNHKGGLIFNPNPHSRNIPGATLNKWKHILSDMRSGKTKVLLVRDANPAYGLPRSINPREALSNLETIVSFSSFLDETTEMADLILPGSSPLEEWGSDEPNPGPGYTTIAFQQPVVNRFHNTISFGDALLQTSKSLELGLPWVDMRDALRSSAKKLHELNAGSVKQPTFEEFWKRSLERGGWWNMDSTYKASPELPPLAKKAPKVNSVDSGKYPFYLVPFEGVGIGAGEYSHLPWAQSAPDPLTSAAWTTWVELNPITAKELDVKDHDIVLVESNTTNAIRGLVYINPATPPQVVAIPMGQGHRAFTSYAAKRGANVLDIIEPTEEVITGSFAWGGTRVNVSRTNRKGDLPKLEGIEPARQLPHEELILVHRDHHAGSDGHKHH